MDDWQARLTLALCVEPGDERIGALVAEFGAVEAMTSLLESDQMPKVRQRLQQAINDQQPDRTINHMNQTHVRFITPTSSEWPVALEDLDLAKPIGLWCRGRGQLTQSSECAISIVGARASTNYGERIASELGTLAAQRNVATISGAAYGIDASVHRGSLVADGKTIAVLACGVDVAYPSAHQGLLSRITENGCLVSEIPLGQSAHKRHFLIRNRIIAALSQSTVVVEAALRSGSLSTANWVHTLGRQVWGIPGPITSATSAGVHAGIKDGMISIVLDLADVLPEHSPGDLTQSTSELSELIINLLRNSPSGMEISQLNVATNSAGYLVEEVIATLSVLEIYGQVIRTSSGWALP